MKWPVQALATLLKKDKIKNQHKESEFDKIQREIKRYNNIAKVYSALFKIFMCIGVATLLFLGCYIYRNWDQLNWLE